MARDKWYVVWEGRAPGVYDSWEECKLLIDGYPGAKYKAFKSETQAVEAFRGNPEDHMGILRSIAKNAPHKVVNYAAFPEIDLNAIAVDASCMGNPGMMEYQGVALSSGERLFRVGPFKGGTNNIGEFLAIIHAAALCKKKGVLNTIYSDSKTAISWVRKGGSNTKLEPDECNAKVMDLLKRANKWLKDNGPVLNRIVKWNTDEWGEIPADFGRK